MKKNLLILGMTFGLCGITFGQIQQNPPLQKTDSLLNSLISKPALVLPVGYRAEDDMFADFKKVRRSTADTIIKL